MENFTVAMIIVFIPYLLYQQSKQDRKIKDMKQSISNNTQACSYLKSSIAITDNKVKDFVKGQSEVRDRLGKLRTRFIALKKDVMLSGTFITNTSDKDSL